MDRFLAERLGGGSPMPAPGPGPQGGMPMPPQGAVPPTMAVNPGGAPDPRLLQVLMLLQQIIGQPRPEGPGMAVRPGGMPPMPGGMPMERMSAATPGPPGDMAEMLRGLLGGGSERPLPRPGVPGRGR